MAVKEEEKNAFVPSLCVFKNEAFLNSIFLTDPEWEENDDEEKLLKLGRHPDCDIVVDHPSISRWHLQIQVQKSSQELLITDLSSVHGTFVCGQRIAPKFPIALRVNDTFRMGASTRVYKFQLLPYPSEEEEDCPTPKLLHTIYEPNKHECSSDGNNKERDISIKKCGQMGAAGSNSWNTTPTSSRIVSEPDETNYRSNDENEEQVSMEERHVNAVESIFRNLASTLSDIFSEHDKQKCERNNENKELALKRKDYFKAVESIVLSNLMETPMPFESVSDLDKQEQERPTIFGKNKEQSLKEHENVKAPESPSDNMSNIPIYSESSFECNKGNGSFASENNDQVLKENGNVGATALSILNSFKSVADANKQEHPFNGENKEQFLKEHSHIEVTRNVEALEPVQNDTLKTPIHLKSASECNKGKGSFVRENNEQQVLNEHGNAGAIQLRILDSLECVSDANEQECAFDGENKEWILEDQDHTEVIEPVQSNPVEIPIFMERISEPKNSAYALAGENKEQVLKEHGHIEAVESFLSSRVNTPNFLESISETDKQECAFDGENKEWILEDQGHTEVIEPVQSNPVEIPIFMERVSEPKNPAYALAGENKEQVLKEHGHVEAVESVLSNRVKTPNFLKSISETDKQECTFIHENKEQILKEYEHVEPVESAPNDAINTLIYMKTVPEWNRGEGSFPSENKEDTLKEPGHAEIIEPVQRNPVEIPIFMDSVSECEKQVSADQDEFGGENKEQVLKENVEPVESVPNSTINTPIYMETVPEWNRGEGSFPSENKEDTLKELGHAESIEPVPSNPVENPIFMDSISECKKVVSADQDEFSVENKEQVLKENVEAVTFVSIKQDYLFANKSNEQASEEHGFVETFEANPINPIKTPILLESVPEPNKQECGLAFENDEHVIKKQSHCGADMLVPYNLTPILSDAILGSNKQDSGFDEENMEQTSMKEGDVKVIESDLRNLNQIILDGIAEPIKQDCEFFHKNKNQFLLEEEYVDLVESVPWKPVQPSAPPLPESHSHLDGFNVVNDFGVTLDRENKRINPGTGASNLWLRRQKGGNLICLQTGRMEMNLNPKKLKENPVKITKQKRMLKENSSSEIIPKGKNVRCDKKNKVLGEKKRDSILQVSPPEISAHGSSSTGFNPDDDDFYPSDKENCTPKVSCQTSKKAARKVGREDQNAHLLQTDTGRAPFQSLSQNSWVKNRPAMSSSLKNTNRSMENHKGSLSEVQISGVVQHSNMANSKKKWLMVVDTGCLIHDESRQALKQLEGIKGTQLIIPRIVIRELDCLKRQNKSKKGKEAQEFLRWIEECMTNKGWWVHVQNSAECFSFGVTPPASPLSSPSAGNNDASASVAFSSYGSFADVLSPTAEDHILECALLYKRLANGGCVVLLSNDVALKVKAMAEGMLCENAKEFCQSLVSPYSERFLWSQSTAHGHNWTDINNISRKTLGVTRKLTYFGMMKNSLLRDEEPKKKSNEGAKGLKLILLHNSHYGQKHT